MAEIVHLNVGGIRYSTTRDTLLKSEVLSNLIDPKFSQPVDGVYFIDRDGNRFRSILDFLRDMVLVLPTDAVEQQMVIREFLFFQIFTDVQEMTKEYTRQWEYGMFPSLKAAQSRSDALRAGFSSSVNHAPDPFVGLIRVFDDLAIFRYAGPIQGLPLIFHSPTSSIDSKPLELGDLGIVYSLPQFRFVFIGQTKGQLWPFVPQPEDAAFDPTKHFDWNNVVVAGGSVLKALLSTKWTRLGWTHATNGHVTVLPPSAPGFEHSDVDIFLHGLSEPQAMDKVRYLLSWFVQEPGAGDAREWNPADYYGHPVVVRSRCAISVSYGPKCPVFQIVLRVFQSPAHVVHSFDIDCCAALYDGTEVYVSERCHRALVHRVNVVDAAHDGPAYARRLLKYARRGFAAGIPVLGPGPAAAALRVREDILARPHGELRGLARILALDRLHERNPPCHPLGRNLPEDTPRDLPEAMLDELLGPEGDDDYPIAGPLLKTDKPTWWQHRMLVQRDARAVAPLPYIYAMVGSDATPTGAAAIAVIMDARREAVPPPAGRSVSRHIEFAEQVFGARADVDPDFLASGLTLNVSS